MRSLTPRIALELLAHEGIVPEAYRDSVGVWTWSVGITNASGHRVHPRYRDNPQPLERCLELYLWLLRTRYLPPVLAMFGEHDPAEHELAAALSFHYNTGAIGRAAWCRRFLAGDRDGARAAILQWCRPPELLPRRRRERDLFFDGQWSSDGTGLLYEVVKPGYRPVRGRRIDLSEAVERLFAPEEPACAAPAQAPGELEEAENWFDRLYGGDPV